MEGGGEYGKTFIFMYLVIRKSGQLSRLRHCGYASFQLPFRPDQPIAHCQRQQPSREGRVALTEISLLS